MKVFTRDLFGETNAKNNKKKVALVTGAAGFIGFHFRSVFGQRGQLLALIVCQVTMTFH